MEYEEDQPSYSFILNTQFVILYTLPMKISLNWLQDFVTLKETDPETIARAVTAKVAEVDEVVSQSALLRDVVVGKVLTVRKHPNADRLSLCDVQTDRGEKKVVCGGSNLRAGMRVAFAHVGARVRWHGTEMVTLEKAKVRGEESEGMICAAEELDLVAQFPQATDRNIIDMGDGDEGVGKPLQDYLGLNGAVLHVDNHAITNRADLFAHWGFAREFVALGLADWKADRPQKPSLNFPQTPFPFAITVEQRKLVPRYVAVMLEIDGLGQTPDWMKRRLEATGWRSINPPIDITNYVMMETGMPLHSFDAADITGDVIMRRAKKGEKITTLDGEERGLSKGALIMEDAEGIFDLLGIMGGLRGSTKESTRRVWLHGAVVDPVNTRQTVIAMGHRTDAATVYEKGVPPVSAETGLFRAIQLFLQLVPGARIASAPISWGEDGTAKTISLKLSRVQSVLGTDVSAERAKKILTDLGCTVEANGKTLKVTTPLWRLGDLRLEQDLIEEIGRVVGYDAIAPVMPAATINPPPRDPRVNMVRDSLKESVFAEVLPLSLVGPALLQKARMNPDDAIKIQNPIGEETSLLHTSTLPGLLEHAQRNLLTAGKELQTFTVSHVFKKVADPEQSRGGSDEWPELGMLRADLEGSGDHDLKRDPFLLLKQDIELALQAISLTAEWKKQDNPPSAAHPGRAARIIINGNDVGYLSEVHPDVRSAFDLPHRAAIAAINLSTVLAQGRKPQIPRALPAFPAITYDVTVPREQNQSTEALLCTLQKTSPLLENIEIIDLYSGKPSGQQPANGKQGTFNLTLRFTYRAPDRTLTENEAQKEQEKVLQALA